MARCGRFTTIAEAIRSNASILGDMLLGIDTSFGRQVTHRQFFQRCEFLGRGLRLRGVEAGSRVCILLQNRLEYVEVYGAAAMGGFVAVPVNVQFSPQEVRRVVEDAQPQAFFVEAQFHELIPADWDVMRVCIGENSSNTLAFEDLIRSGEGNLPALPEVDGDSLWALLYTSGTTTGIPKGAKRSQFSTVAGALTHAGPMGFDDSTRGLICFPLHGISSFFFTFVYVYIGGSFVLANPPALGTSPGSGPGCFGLHLLKCVSEHSVTYITQAPAHFQDMLAVPEDERPHCGSLQQVLLTGATSAPHLRAAVCNLFPSARVFDVYGSTEAGLISMLLPKHLHEKPQSVGRETPGTFPCRVVDAENGEDLPAGQPGLVMVRTPMMFDGYWRRPDLLAADPKTGYFLQGDVGFRDSDGFLHLCGRADDMITTALGANIFPAEVESLLAGISGLQDTVLFGLPNNRAAEKLALAIIPMPGLLARQGGDVYAQLAQEVAKGARHVAVYKRPLTCLFLASTGIPRTANGKLMRNRLCANISALLVCSAIKERDRCPLLVLHQLDLHYEETAASRL